MARKYKKKSPVGYGFKIYYPPEFNEEFKKYIRKRDGLVCSNPKCGKRLRLDVHHIDYNRYNTVKLNCISLCRDCHETIHRSSWVAKQKWKELLWQIAAKREQENASSRQRINRAT